MCRTALTNSAEGRAIGEQFNRAILLLIAAPYAVFGTIVGILCRRRIALWWRRVAPRFVDQGRLG